MNLTSSVEPRPLGTAGALRHAESALKGDSWLVLNGDSLTPCLLAPALLDMADAHPGMGVVAITPMDDAGRYGTVECDENGFIHSFREKAERAAGWISTGVYVWPRSLLARIPAEREVSLESEIFPALASERRLLAFRAPPPLLDMGTPEGLAQMEEFLRRT